ncbi:MAG TPA: beta-ketoacyl-[acyl-carrier-protein] synthase family protein [Candidatus Omnitrophota bacterium]|mgnify:CR=1 FL=1|nr:beta-ketoacyl-[acyl-carrier-protein] synthase family protein [Candidatus Omnitrophota bacterium]HPT06838.1 beta-ketoacyl-[acyl-carrier-protein] synthase family protein [Candidatus Omnitrophota bacterium]
MNRVVITGIGIISPLGIGKNIFADALMSEVSGIKDISLFDTAVYKTRKAGEVTGFDAAVYLGPKGLRTLDRSTRLVSSATKLALDDAGFVVTEENAPRLGVAIGTMFGSLRSIAEFDRDAMVDGPQYVNPAFFPNTVINSPASQVSIKFNCKGFNSTLATGFCASLDAMKYAADFLRLGRVDAVLCGGVEELCQETYLGLYKAGCLAGINGAEIACPFDKRRNGLIIGEGAVIFCLETLDAARKRNAHICAEVAAGANAFSSSGINAYDQRGAGVRTAMRKTVAGAGLSEGDIDCIFAAANATLDADKIEAEAIRHVFSGASREVSVTAIKSKTGECLSASGAIAAAAAVVAIERNSVPATMNFSMPDPACTLNLVTGKARQQRVDTALVNAVGPSGNNTSLLIRRVNL